MLIRSKLIILLAAIICLIGARVDAALSLGARAAIEDMRARVNRVESPAGQNVAAEDTVYIPGNELRTVLASYRTQIYGAPDATESSLTHWRVSVVEPEQLDVNGYRPGQMLAKALDNYRTQRNVFNLVKIMKAKEVSNRDETLLDESAADEASRNKSDAGRVSTQPETSQQPALANSSELLSESESALKISARDEDKLPLPGSVNMSDITAGSAGKSLEPVTASADQKAAETQKFEFKMPRNYRIIVK